jgi:hypothetical protein
MPPKPLPNVTLTPEQAKSRRARNVAIGLLVGALVVLFYVITIAKLGPHVFNAFSGP